MDIFILITAFKIVVAAHCFIDDTVAWMLSSSQYQFMFDNAQSCSEGKSVYYIYFQPRYYCCCMAFIWGSL